MLSGLKDKMYIFIKHDFMTFFSLLQTYLKIATTTTSTVPWSGLRRRHSLKYIFTNVVRT